MEIPGRCTKFIASPGRRRVGRVDCSSNCDVEVIKIESGNVGPSEIYTFKLHTIEHLGLGMVPPAGYGVLDCLVISWKGAVQYRRAGGQAEQQTHWIRLGVVVLMQLLDSTVLGWTARWPLDFSLHMFCISVCILHRTGMCCQGVRVLAGNRLIINWHLVIVEGKCKYMDIQCCLSLT